MGRRRISHQAVVLAVGAAVAVLAGCGGDDGPRAEPTPTASASPTDTTRVPSATPADPLGPPPADFEAAAEALERYFGTSPPACDPMVTTRWSAGCVTGDVDGDGKEDLALLIPLEGTGLRSPKPAVVAVRRAGGRDFERFPAGRAEADASPLGRELFGIVERTGDARPELVYMTKGCTASTCKAVVEVQSWDGTTWRNVGPPDGGIDNLETASFTGTGARSVLTVHGGKVTSLGAGPSRARTVTYGFDGTRYAETAVRYDPPEYLYHAILDADALFAAERWNEAIAAYRAAVTSQTLKDWKYEAQGVNGRAELYGYALFRVAVATAAAGNNPTSALDEVIVGAKDELFQKLASAFRQGFQQGGSPQDGCLAVTSYLATPPVPDRVDEMFNYGTANPRKTTLDVCGL